MFNQSVRFQNVKSHGFLFWCQSFGGVIIRRRNRQLMAVTQSVVNVTNPAVTARRKIQVSGTEPRNPRFFRHRTGGHCCAAWSMRSTTSVLLSSSTR
ncbi:hypothetical protein BRQ86_13995 [Salmonella enterica]|nr:hypothetical protein [Salmonella enterica]